MAREQSRKERKERKGPLCLNCSNRMPALDSWRQAPATTMATEALCSSLSGERQMHQTVGENREVTLFSSSKLMSGSRWDPSERPGLGTPAMGSLQEFLLQDSTKGPSSFSPKNDCSSLRATRTPVSLFTVPRILLPRRFTVRLHSARSLKPHHNTGSWHKDHPHFMARKHT